ncbi:ATP-binding protein [Streptomyces sp. NPDC048641]|uniref:ATP-binding protein n=1 Tax=unclassified Streptomyces TaxID=2593676 RepID=UPI00344333D9
MGPDQVQIPATFAGVAATAASSACVWLLIRAQAQLRRSTADAINARAELGRSTADAINARAELQQQAKHHQEQHAEHQQKWEEHLAGLRQEFAVERSALEAQLAEEAQVHEARLGAEAERQLALFARLADAHLPSALERLRAGDAIDDVLAEVDEPAATPELRAEVRKFLRAALIAVEEQLDRATSAEHSVVSIASRLQALISGVRGRLHELQTEHGQRPAVAKGLMELDQRLGPADGLAASVAVLGGSVRPGRQWQEPQKLLSVVRGGQGRIKDFDRVRVDALPELGVDGGLVDHLTLIFAHVLDNAARYSPPSEPVQVSGRQVPAGVGIQIQDAGKGLSEEKQREAEQALAGTATGPGLGGISENANLGLRVVGILARRYGIRVTFTDSPWGGTSVVILVPHKYFSALPAAAPKPVAAAAVAEPSAEPAPVPAPEATDTTPGGLPRRKGLRSAKAELIGHAVHTEEAVADVPSVASFDGLTAFATAGRQSGPPLERNADRDAAGGGESAGRDTEESD